MESKSWFQRWNFKQENINTQNEQQEKEKEFTFVINDRPLNSVKADLIHAFLSVSLFFFLPRIIIKKHLSSQNSDETCPLSSKFIGWIF